jgi:hypothetical protein
MSMRAPSPRAKRTRAPTHRTAFRHAQTGTASRWTTPDTTGDISSECERWATRDHDAVKAKAKPNLYRPHLFTPKANEVNA